MRVRVRASRERTRAVRECVCVCVRRRRCLWSVRKAEHHRSPISNPRILAASAVLTPCCPVVQSVVPCLPTSNPCLRLGIMSSFIPSVSLLRIAPHPCVTDTKSLIVVLRGYHPFLNAPQRPSTRAHTLCSTRTLETHMRALPHASNAALCTAFLHSRLFAWPASAAPGLSTTRDSVGS